VTSATITTRLLSTEREKTITTAILQFAIPCSAQIAVIAALLVAAGPLPMLVYTVVIASVLIGIGTVLNRWLPGSSAPLLLDLPPMRLPRFRNVIRKTGFRTFAFMKEATGWFFVGALAVAVLQLTGLLAVFVRFLTPLTTSWLQLPADAARAFIMGVVRRDFGAAGLYQLTLSPMQITVALITITLFVPCIASLVIMLKERGMKEGLLIWIGTWVAAFAIGGIVSQVLV
jgi:ferrous iron transport protein B